MITKGSNDFGPLLGAMSRVGVFYGIGIIATFAQSEIMVYRYTGNIKRLKNRNV